MATRRDQQAAFGAVAHMMPSRQGDKNNRYLVGHAAYGQGLTLLERCEFEDALVSLEGAWSVWKEVFIQEAVSSSESDKSGDENKGKDGEDDDKPQVKVYSHESAPSVSSSSEDHPPAPPKHHHSPLEANAERFFRAKACVNIGKNQGGRLPPKRVGGAANATMNLRGFADEADTFGDADVDDFLGTWPPVNKLDTFACCFDDALALRIQKEAEDEAFACALEVQNKVGRGRPPSSDSEGEVLHEEGEEEDELTTESYNRMMYKRDVQTMMKPSEAIACTAPQRIIGAKPQFHHFRRLMRGLCHCYVRLRRWADLDRIIEEAMPYFGHPVGSLRPSHQRFKTPAMEDLWISLTLQRAIAGLLVGRDHYAKARRLLELVLDIEPKRRSLACAFRSIRFLQEQVQSGAQVLSGADKDLLLSNALIALKES